MKRIAAIVLAGTMILTAGVNSFAATIPAYSSINERAVSYDMSYNRNYRNHGCYGYSYNHDYYNDNCHEYYPSCHY